MFLYKKEGLCMKLEGLTISGSIGLDMGSNRDNPLVDTSLGLDPDFM